jgi:hypothetical protein
MFLTEEEAKTKWCPHVRYLAIFRANTGTLSGDQITAAGPYNRAATSPELCPTTCIASGCMMWRSTLNGRGYCGLAGNPK